MVAPTLTTTSGNTNFVEGDNTVSLRYVVDPGITIADADSTSFASATVSITSGYQSGVDSLVLTPDASMGNITRSWVASTGVMTLSSAGATATLEQWQAALRQIAFNNSSQTPTGGDRTISFVLNDGASNSAVVSKTVSVSPINDATNLGVGRVTTDFGASESARAITVLPDGKFLVSGISSVSGVSSFSEARYNPDGSLDSTFGTAGIRTTEFVNGPQGNAVFNTVMGTDGKAIALGYIVNDSALAVPDTRWALARYNADGTLDTTFDADGKQTLDLRNYSNLNHAAVQADGKILVTGDQGANPVWYGDTGVARFNADGSIDTSFGAGGLVTLGFGTDSAGYRVLTLSNDKILVACGIGAGATGNLGLVRLNGNGTLDTSFDVDGIVTTSLGASYARVDIDAKQQTDQKIVVLAAAYNALTSGTDAFLLRYNVDGSLDTGFDADGKVAVNGIVPKQVTLQPDGGLLVTGSFQGNFAVIRYNSVGVIDTTFGTAGRLITDFGTSGDTAYTLAIDANGKLVVAGSSNGNFALARYNSDGSLDASFVGQPQATLGGTMILDGRATLVDPEMGVTGYGGSTLTLERAGGPSANDVFVAKAGGSLGALTEGSSLTVAGTVIGSVVSNHGGTLQLSFSSSLTGNVVDGANQTLVNSAIRQLAYTNAVDPVGTTVHIDWKFNDGNTGAQGPGSAQTIVGSSIIKISADNGVTLVGTVGDDSLTGGTGNDYMAGGLGIDTLTGGAGSDTFGFWTTIDDLSTDAVTDFVAGVGGDSISAPTSRLTNYTSGGNQFTTGHLRLTQSGLDTLVEVDADGAIGPGAYQTVVVLSNVSKASLVASNFNGTDPNVNQGTDLADSLTGTSASDLLNGGGGNDTVSGLAGNDTLYGGAGQDLLDGGAGNDLLFGNEGNDSISGGAGFDSLYGGAGNDTFDGGADSDTVNYSDATGPITVNLALGTANGAGIGTDTLISIENVYGSQYADILIGGVNSDNLTGGLGNDTLTGGAGTDFFNLRNGSNDTSVDAITDFVAGKGGKGSTAGDSLSIPTFQFTNYTSGANPFASGHARLTQQGPDTLVELDADGPTGPASFQIAAVLSNVSKSALVANNLGGYDPNAVVGTANADVMTGTAGNDSMDGAAGNDTISGLVGNDTLAGGLGDDVIDGGDGGDQLYGNDGNDSLTGGAGSDNFYGELGNDTLDGGADSDSVQYFDATGAVTVNLALGTATGAGIGTDTLISIENVYGSQYADTLTGDASYNNLSGGLGNDTLTGGVGPDYFQLRNSSNDTSVDTITDFAVGNGGDQLSIPTWMFTNYTNGANPFSTGHARLTQQGADTWLELDADGSTGSGGFQTIAILSNVTKGTLAASNLNGFNPGAITGTAGADSLTGTAGDDQIDGAAGNDTINGLAGNDTLYGGLDNDVIDGGAGNDQLYGNDGNDSLTGGAGYDNFFGGAGNDTIEGGADSDTVNYADATSPITVNLALGTATGASIGTDTLISIESVYGSPYADILIGGANSDNLTGGLGNDTLTGGAGTDFFNLRNGSNDTSVDTITDFVAGKGGKGSTAGDFLSIPTFQFTNYTSGANPFASGHARLTQQGPDTLVELDADGPTGPASFQTAAVLSNVSKSALVANNLGGYDPNAVVGTANADVMTGTAGNDSMDGAAGNDTISGLAGNDTLDGGLGDDSIDGGAGTDTARYLNSKIADWSIVAKLDGSFELLQLTTGEKDTLRNIESVQFQDGSKALAASFYASQQATGWNSINGTDYAEVINADSLAGANAVTYRDIINGGLGNDSVHAGQGGDQISGGSGDDLIDGGEDTTLARLNPALVDTWSTQNQGQYSGPAARYEILQATDNSTPAVTGTPGSTYYTVKDLRPGSPDGIDTVYKLDGLFFSDKFVRLTPDFWFNKMTTLVGVVSQTQLLGLNATGTDFADVIGVLPGNPPTGTYDFAGSDNLKGNAGNDTLYGGAGADTLRGDTGNDRLDGGANRASNSTSTWDPNGSNGVDVAEFSGKTARYAITFKDAGGTTVGAYDPVGTVVVTDSKTSGGEGQDTLSNIEVLRFADGEINLAVVSNSMSIRVWNGSAWTDSTAINWKGTGWDDTINTGNIAANVQAGAGNDSITGSSAADTVDGGAGNDTIDGAAGKDMVRFDATQSRFTITKNSDLSFKVADKLTAEFGGLGTDTLSNVESLQFSDGNKTLQVNFQAASNGSSMNNVQGTEFADMIEADTLAGNSPATSADWIQPGEGNDVVYAGAGGDYILDGVGNDFYDGGSNGINQDVVQFNGAQKRYVVDVLDYTNAPADIQALISTKYAGNIPSSVIRVTDKLPDGDGVNYLINIERIQFTDGSVNLGVNVYQTTDAANGMNNYNGGILGDLIDATGHNDASANNVVSGFNTNRDWINGGAGNDTLMGGAGGDQLQGDKGNDLIDGGGNGSSGNIWNDMDRVVYSNSINRYDILFYRKVATGTGVYDAMGLTTSLGSKDYAASGYYAADGFIGVTDRYSDTMGGDGRDVLRNIEQLQFSDASETLAVQYNDSLITQSVWSVTGQATGLFGGDAGSVVSTDVWGYVDIQVSNRFGWGTRFGDLLMGKSDGQNNLYGNAGSDSITGGDLRDHLAGGTGNDTIDGGANPAADPARPWDTWTRYDVAQFDSPRAQFDIQKLSDSDGHVTGTPGKGYYTVTHLIPAALGGLGTDTVFNVERLQFSDRDMPLQVQVNQYGGAGSSNAWYGGTDFADVITGTDADNNFKGGAGNDTIVAGTGNDFIDGGAGNDSNDGGSGNDVAQYSDSYARYTLTLNSGVITVSDSLAATYGGNGTDTLRNVETVQFSDGNWTGGTFNSYNLSATAQTVTGTSNNDNLAGGLGNDTILAGDGDDFIHAGPGDDSIDGGADTSTNGSSFWSNGDVLNYGDAPRSRFDITDLGLINGTHSYRVVDLASIKNIQFSNGHLSDVSSANVSVGIGFGIDTITNVEQLQFSDTMLALVSREYQNYINVNNTQTAAGKSYIGTFAADVLTGTGYGDYFQGNGGNDTIDGAVEAVPAGANQWDYTDTVRYDGGRARYEIAGVIVRKDSNSAYAIVDPALAAATDSFAIQVKDLLPDSAGGNGTDLLLNVDRLQFGDTSVNVKPSLYYYDAPAVAPVAGVQPKALSASGTDFADAISGTAYNDWISGGAGDDTLVGGTGGDDLEGGAGSDLLIGGTNAVADANGHVRTDTARYNAPFERFEISSITYQGQAALQVRDLLPAQDGNSLGIDILVGVESLSFNNRWVDVGVRRWAWNDGQGQTNASAEGTVFNDVIYGDLNTDGTTAATGQRDQIRGNAGNDVLIGLGGGDNLQGGEGDDVLDGGANGTTGDAGQDQAQFSGNSSRYLVQVVSIGTDSNGVSHISVGNSVLASFRADTANSMNIGSSVVAATATVLQNAYDNLTLAGDHSSGYLVTDSLSGDLGGDGTDLVFNVETLWFANGPLEVEIRVNVNDWNGDGALDWVNVTGTSNADTVVMAKLVALSGKTEAQLIATRIDVDLRDGNDVYIGGSGGDSVRTGLGNDYVDGGANSGIDQWGNSMRDDVRFDGTFGRYNLIDLTLANNSGSWTLNSTALGLAGANTTLASLPTAFSTLVLADLNSAITAMMDHAGSQTSVTGWLVADRLPAAFQGGGVDALVNVEALSFSDKWLPLGMQVYYQRATNAPNSAIISAYVDGTQGADTIGTPTATYDYAGNDNLRGNEGSDSIMGGAGGDWISGGAGNDTIDGGANGVDAVGNARIDVAQYSGEFARYTITANSNGTVTVSDSQLDGDGTDALANVEAVSFSDRYVRLGVETWINKNATTGKVNDVQLNGSMLDDTIDVSADSYQGVRHVLRGNEGNDTLTGGAGPDDFEGGAGDDSIVGGANGTDTWGNPGFDVARYQGAYARYTIEYSTDGGLNWVAGTTGGATALVRVTDTFSASDGGTGVDSLSGIEALSFFDRFVMLKTTTTVQDLNGDGRPDNSDITGTENADTLIGGVTNDHIKGGAGADSISGGAGGDILNGGGGNDTLDGGANGTDMIDVAEYAGAASLYTVTKNGNGSFTVSSSAEGTDTLTNIEGLQFSDRFVNLVQVISRQDLNKDGAVDLIDIRGLDLASVPDTIAPASGDQGIAHRMAGGDGNDTLSGGSTADVFVGGGGNDSITGGDGIDRAVFSGSYADYTISGNGTVTVIDIRNGSPDGTDTLNGIEELAFSDKVVKLGTATVTIKEVDTDGNQKVDTAYITGTDGADAIDRSASTLINFIDTGPGNDSIKGGSGADTFNPGSGNDTVAGGANDGLDGAGNPNVDRVTLSGIKSAYTIHTLQSASFSVSGAVEVGDVVSVTIGAVTVSYTATGTSLTSLQTGLAGAIATAQSGSSPALSSAVTVTSTLNGNQIDYVVKSTDALAAVSAAANNGTHAVSGSFAVNAGNQSGSSLVVADATGLAPGMHVSYSVITGSGAGAVTTAYGPYQIASISGTTLTLDQSLGASPAASASLTVTQDNTDTTLAAGSVSYDRWFEVSSGSSPNVETDTLREVEQLVFSDGVTDLSFKTGQKAAFGNGGLSTVFQIQGTDLADVMRSSNANEIFSGGLGADHFVFSDGSGQDEIRDFVVGSTGDRITLVLGAGDSDGLNATGVNTATLALARASQQGSDVMIDLGAGNSIKLIGVSLDGLLAANFEVTNTF